MTTLLCSNCDFRNSVQKCITCAETPGFCKICAGFHLKLKAFKSHMLGPIIIAETSTEKILCYNCDTAVAKFKCVECTITSPETANYCLGCSIIHPKVKPYIGHTIEASSSSSTVAKKSSSARSANKSGRAAPLPPVEMTVIEDEGEDREGQYLGALNWIEAQTSQLLSSVSRILAKYLKLDDPNSSILEDKRKLGLLAGVFLLSYWLMKRLLGRNVSIVIVAGSLLGLRFFQNETLTQMQTQPLKSVHTDALQTGLNGLDASSLRPASLRSLSAAAAAADEIQGAEDEFWHGGSKSPSARSHPRMRIHVKMDKGATKFNPASDT